MLRKQLDFEKNFLRALPGLQPYWDVIKQVKFHRIGEGKLLNIVKGNEEYYNALDFLRKSLQIEDHLFDMIESILCQAYGFLNKRNVNDVRYEKFCEENFREASKISPINDELHQHVKRVNYQAFVCNNALETN